MGLFLGCSLRGSQWTCPEALGHLFSGWPCILSYWSQPTGLEHASSYIEKPSDCLPQINWLPFNTEGSGISFQMQQVPPPPQDRVLLTPGHPGTPSENLAGPKLSFTCLSLPRVGIKGVAPQLAKVPGLCGAALSLWNVGWRPTAH